MKQQCKKSKEYAGRLEVQLKGCWTKGSKNAKKPQEFDSSNYWMKFNKGGMGIGML